MSFELVIFDCDGVLVDSELLSNRILAERLTAIGLPTTTEDSVRDYMGRSLKAALAEVEQRLGRALPAGFEDAYYEETFAAFARELEPVAGIHAALDEIALPSCVASSGPHAKIRHSLGLTGLLERFDGRIFSASDVEHGKPAPDLFLHAAARMGVDPAACAVVEDSRFGVMAARAAGMQAFGYAGGLTPAHRLGGLGTVVFDDMRELPGLLAAGRD
jgi:HAD superfamily hydrolase (TIGR01509 family)